MSDQEKIIPETAPKLEIIQQISKALLERRMARSLTLEKVTQNIKIRIPYLQAMEKGEWKDLPGEVYVRGFVKRYANYLGLDGEKLLAPYLKLNEPMTHESTDSGPAHNGDPSRVYWIGAVLAGIFLIGFIKVIKQERTAPIKSALAKKLPVAEVLSKPDIAKLEEPKIISMKHELEVYSPFPLWLRVNASEKSFEGFIPQGATWTWKGEGAFTLRLGHTKEVHVQFDGKQVLLAEDQMKITLPL